VRGVLAGFSLGAWLLLRTPAGKSAGCEGRNQLRGARANGALRVWQERLTEPHPLKAIELAQSAIKGVFVLFSTTLLGRVGFVLQKNHSFFSPHKMAL
jgi:hypothetical protein